MVSNKLCDSRVTPYRSYHLGTQGRMIRLNVERMSPTISIIRPQPLAQCRRHRIQENLGNPVPQPDPPSALANIVQQCCLQEHNIATTLAFQNPQDSQTVLLESGILAKEKLSFGRWKVPL